MGCNWAKIAHLAEKKIFGEISCEWFLSGFFALSCYEVSFKIVGADPEKFCELKQALKSKLPVHESI